MDKNCEYCSSIDTGVIGKEIFYKDLYPSKNGPLFNAMGCIDSKGKFEVDFCVRDLVIFHKDIKFNYCPMCGRKIS